MLQSKLLAVGDVSQSKLLGIPRRVAVADIFQSDRCDVLQSVRCDVLQSVLFGDVFLSILAGLVGDIFQSDGDDHSSTRLRSGWWRWA